MCNWVDVSRFDFCSYFLSHGLEIIFSILEQFFLGLGGKMVFNKYLFELTEESGDNGEEKRSISPLASGQLLSDTV